MTARLRAIARPSNAGELGHRAAESRKTPFWRSLMKTDARWSDPREALAGRVELTLAPTPLHVLSRFSQEIGVEVWAKRDDAGSVGLLGNKVRKLEFLIADAERLDATVLVTVGAIQSNHARTTACAAAMRGLRCVLILGGKDAVAPSGNYLLDQLFGAEVELVAGAEWDELEPMLAQKCRDLEGEGERPYLIPAGGSTPVGALGLARGYLELAEQLDAHNLTPELIVHATSSGGTQAGLEVGRAILGRGPRILGVAVAKSSDVLEAEVAEIATDAARLVGIERSWALHDVAIDHSQRGQGYGVPTAASEAAIRLLAHTEGILTDPVYSGKALAGLIDQGRNGRLRGPVVFWHTGGTPALFDADLGLPLIR
jgi:D-cysteine desulfhydrase family pyridoxal phosphate-dependent enzyme